MSAVTVVGIFYFGCSDPINGGDMVGQQRCDERKVWQEGEGRRVFSSHTRGKNDGGESLKGKRRRRNG